MESTLGSTFRYKTMNSSQGIQTIKAESCPIKIKPQLLEFVNVQINQKYEMPITIRNQGKQSQKIRIILPTSLFFSMKSEPNPFTIAPGLSAKLMVYFHLQGVYDCSNENYDDKIVIIGNSFKKQLQLKAYKPNFKLQMPKIFNLGLIRLGKQTRYLIPIKNVGKEDVQIAVMQSSSPNIIIEDQKLVVKKQTETQLKIKAVFPSHGIVEELIFFPNGQKITLKGVCSQQSIQIYNKQGKVFKSHNFGVIYIGQKIIYPFYIINNSTVKIEGLAKVFDKNIAQYANFKVDLVKMTFINRNNPKRIIQQQKSVNFKCLFNKFTIQSFEQFQNKLTIFKQPKPEELKLFQQSATMNYQKENRQSTWNTTNEIDEILYIKFINNEQPTKIPLQFTPILPKLKVSRDKFQFLSVLEKQTAKLGFTVKNCNQKTITIKLEKAGNFYFQGNTTIKPFETNQYYLCFRPLIAGQYSQHLKLTLFDVWTIDFKAFGQCCSIKSQNKQNMRVSLSKFDYNKSAKSTLFLSEQRKKRKQNATIKHLKSKLTQRTSMGFFKNMDEPIDLLFDACQNPKVTSNKKFTIKNISSGLFFNNEQYFKAAAQKRKVAIQSNRLNIKQIVKFSQELTPIELSKIQVKCDRLDFGSVFVGSFSSKQLIIVNKNNKPILIELDLGNNQCIGETKAQMRKVEAYTETKFLIKLKPAHLGNLRIPLCYIINKQHVFQIDIIANVTLINLGFSVNQLQFHFSQNDQSLQKLQSFVVTNYGSTSTKFVIIEPNNKSFAIVSNKQQQVLPNSSSNVVVKYKPLEGNQSGQLRVDSDKLIVKVLGGAQNIIKCQGSVYESKYSVKQTEINLSQAFISMVYQNRLTIRNHAKNETAIKVELSPPTLSEVISLDQRNFVLSSEQKKQLSFTIISHQVKVVKGSFIISARSGKTIKIPIVINFCFPNVQVVGCSQIDLGTVHIMTNHFQRQITLINKTKTEIKLETDREDSQKMDYIIEFIAAQQRVELTMRDTVRDSEKDQKDQQQIKKQIKKRQICVEDRLCTTTQIKNPKNISKIISLSPGIQTKFKMKFIPKLVKTYQIKIPLFMHKATRQIEPIPQKIKCKAVQPLFYVNPYLISFNNVIISENQYANKRQFEIINPHDKEVDWQISDDYLNFADILHFQILEGSLKPKQSKKVALYFRPTKQGVYNFKIKLYSRLDKQILVDLQVNGNAVSPRINFNKNMLILPVVPIKTESKGVLYIQNYGYQTVSISKVKFSHNFQGVDLRYAFLDGKLLSLAKKKLKVQISFKAEMPISFTTNFEIFDEYGQKISIPISATTDHCIMTTYPYLQMNNSTVIYDSTDNMLKLLISKTFNSKNKQTNISGSSAVTGNFIKKWCNYELNINMSNFPDGFVDSRGELLYEMIIKMANGRPIVKRPCFTTEQKISKMLQLHLYYSEVIKILQVEGAFLNHIRPQHLLNMNDYLLYMFHNGYILEEQQQFQCLSHDAWTILFYQLCKLYVEPVITEKFIQKFNFKRKIDRSINSSIYSESQILIVGFINQYLGQQKLFSLSDQAKLFEAIQRIIEKTFKISLSEDLSKLKINADSLMLHEFMILVSKFLYSHLHEFGLSMYLQPNDLFTMGYKQFILFFISLMQNLVNFQSYSVIQFQSALGQKNQKIIELQNPSKKKKLKYWIKIFGSNNFKSTEKQIEIQPQEIKNLRIAYHCKKNTNEQGQLVLVPVKGQDYFTHANSLNFLLKNILISKLVMKRTNAKVHLYEIKTLIVDIELPTAVESCQYDVKIAEGQSNINQSEFSNFYLMQPGQRIIKNGRDRCQVKIAPLQLGDISFKIFLISSTFQQYIYQFFINVTLPNISQVFKFDPMTTDKQEQVHIQIPFENQQKQQCLKFHREINKDKDKKKKTQYLLSNKTKTKLFKAKYQLQFLEQDCMFQLGTNFIDFSSKEKDKDQDKDKDKDKEKQKLNCKLPITACFSKPYRQYKSLLVVKNVDLADYRVYELNTSVTIRPKIFNIKLQSKARQTIKVNIPNKMTPFNYRFQKNIPQLTVQTTQSTQLTLVFSPKWVIKDELDFYIQSPQTFQQHIYKVKIEAKLPDPIQTIQISASSLFPTPFQIDTSGLKLSQKQISQLKFKSQIARKSQMSIKKDGEVWKIVGKLFPSTQSQLSSVKIFTLKTDQYYEYMLNIKSMQVVDLGVLHLQEKIGEMKKFTIKDINAASKDFYFEYSMENYLSHEITSEKEEKITKDRKPVEKNNFVIIFKPTKQLECEKIFKFRSNNKQYVAKIALVSKKLESINVPVIITQNLQKKSATVIVSNHCEIEGSYNINIQNQNRFKTQFQKFQIKGKQRIHLKVNFIPMFIGDTCKTNITLKSQNLPQLTYCLEGLSKFKCKQAFEEIEGYEGIQAEKNLVFTNQFSQKQRFKFEIVSSSADYIFDQGVLNFVRDIQPNQQFNFKIINKCCSSNLVSEQQAKPEPQGKIVVIRTSNRKIVKEYNLTLSIVKKLQDKKYVWECKARETLFQSIKLPNLYPLKQIKSDPQIEKYISFNIDQKNENEAKVKFSPLKPIKGKNYNILLISDKIKFRIVCFVKVAVPSVDDTIIIRTENVKQTGIAVFKLTNIVREPASYSAYFEKRSQELSVQSPVGVLDNYGKSGTPIVIKFKSDIHNKRVEDRLIVETDSMYWIFKVIGMQEKVLNF